MYVIGTHIKTIFYNETNGFLVGLIKIKETDNSDISDEIVWVGYALTMREDEEYKFWGEIEYHQKYGRQLMVTKIEKIVPKTTNRVILYLSSELFPQIGEQTAQKIVDVLGVNAIAKILENPKALDKVAISPEKKDIIYQNLLANEKINQIMTELVDFGFSMAEAVKIYNHFQGRTADIISSSLFEIYFQLPEISFIKIDNIARLQDVSDDDFYRQSAFLLYYLRKNMFNMGHCYIEKDNLLNAMAANKFDVIGEKLDQFLSFLAENKQIIIEEERIFLFDYYYAEEYIASFFKNIKKTSLSKNLNKSLKQVATMNKITYDNIQQEAIKMVIGQSFCLISGGPGTGKSTIIKGIVDLYGNIRGLSKEDLQKEVAILAPTGRASKRLRDITKMPAMTIHRFLRWQKEKNEFLINETNKSKKKVVIVDEASMIDLLLFVNLLKGLTNNVKLIIIGDVDQLPPVAPGQVFKDLILSKQFPIIYLTNNYRAAENNFQVTLANLVKNGIFSNQLYDDFDDYRFVACQSSEIGNEIIKVMAELTPKDVFDVQIIAPIYRGINGIDRINQKLQKVLNCYQGREIKYKNVVFREQDKVIQLNNMPENDIFNGDMGIITKISESEETASGKTEIIVDYYGKKVVYQASDLYHLKHAYAISIHKAQGSEFSYVIMPLCRSYYRMLYRLLFYTGVTRSQVKLILIGEKEMLEKAIENDAEIKRNSYLIERLIV